MSTFTLADRAKQKAELNTEEKQMAIFYGESFSGKTYGVGQFAKRYNLKWLDLEKGATTLLNAVPEEFFPNVELININDTPQNPIACRTVNAIVNAKGPIGIDHETGKLLSPKDENATIWDPTQWTANDILVIDSLTALGDSAINNYLGANSTMVFKKKEYSHYDSQGMYLKNIFVSAQRLPCHVIFISHVEELEQEDGSQKLTPTGGTRNFAKLIARKFDHAVYCAVHNFKHNYNSVTIKDHRVIAGSRNNVDIQELDDIPYLFSGSASKPSTNDSAIKPTLNRLRK